MNNDIMFLQAVIKKNLSRQHQRLLAKRERLILDQAEETEARYK